MGNSLKIFAVLLSMIWLSGCVGMPDKEGWHYAQKSEFLDILKTDKYASICNNKRLYEKVLQNENSVLMSKMLVAYAKNLANSCIDLESFAKVQKHRNSIHFSSKYTTYMQKVDMKNIAIKLKAGQSIEQILKPYVPEYYQFSALLKQYNALKNTKEISNEVLQKIRLNIERVKLMKPGFGKNYVLVNIPEFKVRIIESNTTALAMRIVVGKRDKQTPVFAAELQSVVLNPTWNVPDSIARHEIIPKALKDPNYLKNHRLVIRRDYNLESPVLRFDPKVSAAYVGGEGEVPFKFIEVASGRNALGRVKFLFPNENAVYMHDTPAKHLFKKKVRAYSHGCVRLGNPMKMLDFISTNYTNETLENVYKEYKSKKTHLLKIVKRLPVHTAYLTSYVAEDGKLHMFNDIYSYDKLQKLNF